MLLSLYENSSFLENLIILLKDVPNGVVENNDTATATPTKDSTSEQQINIS